MRKQTFQVFNTAYYLTLKHFFLPRDARSAKRGIAIINSNTALCTMCIARHIILISNILKYTT